MICLSPMMKMEAIKIETLEEYFIVRNRGIEPLFHYNELELDHDLRIELQNKMFSNYLFGEEDIQAANNRFSVLCGITNRIIAKNA